MGRPNSFYMQYWWIAKSSGVVGAEPPPQGNNWPRGSTPEGFCNIPCRCGNSTAGVASFIKSCLREIEKGNIECQNNKTLYLVTERVKSTNLSTVTELVLLVIMQPHMALIS